MSDGSLSQDEIDALLSGGLDTNLSDAPVAASQSPAPSVGGSSMVDIASLHNVYSQNVNSLDSVLKTMLDNTSVMSAPSVIESNRDDLLGILGDEVVVINADFSDVVSGQHLYILGVDLATSIAGKMQGLEQAELNDAGIGALEEAVNTLAGSTSTFLSSSTGKSVSTSIVKGEKLLKASIQGLEPKFIKIIYPYSFDGVGASEIIEIIGLSAAAQLYPGMQQPQMQQMQPQMQQMQPQMQQMQPQMQQMPIQQYGMPAGVQPVQFTPLNQAHGSGESGNIGLLMDVFMEMTVELGRTKRLIKDILGMGEGTIIELDKLAGEPVDILVNHKLIAKGEVVVIDENFGVRVTEIVSPMERVSDV